MLLERLQYKRKKRGKLVPLGTQSRKEIYEMGAAYVHKLQDEGLSHEAAIDGTVKTYPHWFGADAGVSLANFMKRGSVR